MTRKGGKEAAAAMESQDGAGTPQPQRTARGADRTQEGAGKSHKPPKQHGAKQTKDMLYYAQKMQESQNSLPSQSQLADIGPNGPNGATEGDDTLPLESSPVSTPDLFETLQDETQ